MEPSLPIVRIVILGSTSTVLQSAGSARLTEVSAPKAASSQAGTSVVALRDTHAALARLGGEVSIDLVSDPHADLSALALDSLDLFVLDCIDREEASLWLELVRDIGPPVLAIQRDDDDDSALQLFRCGADQCVRLGSDYMHVVPATALEMIHRWQQKRERGQVERHIEWLEDFNDAIVNQIPAALAVIDGEGKVATLNPLFSQLLGVAAGEAPGQLFSAVCDAELYRAAGFDEMVEATHRGVDVVAREARWTSADGAAQVFDVRSQQLDDNGHVLLVLTDVSQIERQAEQIGELQRYNANIIQNINSALLVVSRSRKINYANSAAESILGVECGKLPGRRIADWFRDDETGVHLIVQTLMDGVRFKGSETLVTREDGRLIPIGISCSPLLDAAGETLGAIAIFQDLSEVKQLERQAMQSEKMASIGQLAAGVAHEINNPVGFIRANLFQMSEYLEDLQGVWTELEALQLAISSGENTDVIRAKSAALKDVSNKIDLDYVRSDFTKAVGESQEGSERIRHIVKDLRDFSRQDSAKSELADINECLESTANIVWTMAKHAVTLEKDLGVLPKLRCYPMQLKQVFMNLLHNASQAIEERIAEEEIDEVTSGEVVVRTFCKDGGVGITITDNGTGVAPEHMARIFDPFFTTKEVGAGTGLGLSTSYNIVARHGGNISVSSEVGKGTTFDIWLPESVNPDAGDRTDAGVVLDD